MSFWIFRPRATKIILLLLWSFHLYAQLFSPLTQLCLVCLCTFLLMSNHIPIFVTKHDYWHGHLMFSFLRDFVNAVIWKMLFIPLFLPFDILPILEDLDQVICTISWLCITYHLVLQLYMYIFFLLWDFKFLVNRRFLLIIFLFCGNSNILGVSFK